eukprot:g8246.t1
MWRPTRPGKNESPVGRGGKGRLPADPFTANTKFTDSFYKSSFTRKGMRICDGPECRQQEDKKCKFSKPEDPGLRRWYVTHAHCMHEIIIQPEDAARLGPENMKGFLDAIMRVEKEMRSSGKVMVRA